MPIQESISL